MGHTGTKCASLSLSLFSTLFLTQGLLTVVVHSQRHGQTSADFRGRYYENMVS